MVVHVPALQGLILRGSLLAFILTASCRHDEHAHPHPHEPDDHEDKTAQVTVWSDRFEIFLEHELIAAGQRIKFVTHVTDLKTHEPRREGLVKFVWQLGAEPAIEHVDPAPARPGIYTPRLTFPKAGTWTVTLYIPTDDGENVVALGSFTVFPTHEDTHKASIPAPPDGITFLKEQQWKLRSKTEPTLKRRLVERLRVAGRVAERPGSRAQVTAPLAGRLLPPPGEALPALGTRVEAGQTLALVQPPFSDLLVKIVEAEAEVVRARLGVELAEISFARVQKLADQQFKSPREREEAEFALRRAKASDEAARALQAAYHRAGANFTAAGAEEDRSGGLPTLALRAPIAGTVTQVAATVGEHVSPERAVLTILDPEWVYIEARVPESDLDRVAAAGAAAYELPHAPGERHQILAGGAGRAVHVGLDVDPATRTIPFIYEVRNSSRRLRVGLALNLYLETARAEDAVAIPESAVVDEQGRPIAFVQVSGETFDKRYLTLGLRDSGFIEVKSGLAAGERVASKEAYAIRLASISTSIPAHGHAH